MNPNDMLVSILKGELSPEDALKEVVGIAVEADELELKGDKE